jgi:hypothetical protein
VSRPEDGNLPSIFALNQESGNAKLTCVTPLQAIRRFCWNCMGGHEYPVLLADGTTESRYRPTQDVRDCENPHCWLHIYRLGTNPSRTGVGCLKNVSETPTQRPESGGRTAKGKSDGRG